MAMPPSDRSGASELGDFLRTAREHRGLTLEQIASETRIPLRYLDALEHGNLSALPHGMYRRAELRAYADAVGVDRAVAIERLERALAADAPPPIEPEPPRRWWTPGRLAALVALSGIAALATFAWMRLPAPSPGQPAETAPAPSPHVPMRFTGDRHPLRAPEAADAGSTASDHAVAQSVVGTAYRVAAAPPPSPDLAAAARGDTPPAPAWAEDAATVPPGETALVISTDPAGARVLVDDVGWGISPVTIRHLRAGERRVRVIKDGYASAEQVVHIMPGRATTLMLPMTPRP